MFVRHSETKGQALAVTTKTHRQRTLAKIFKLTCVTPKVTL